MSRALGIPMQYPWWLRSLSFIAGLTTAFSLNAGTLNVSVSISGFPGGTQSLEASGSDAQGGLLLRDSEFFGSTGAGASGGVFRSANAKAAAWPGELRIFSNASTAGSGTGVGNGQASSSTTARFALDDVILTGPAPQVSGVLRLEVSGDLRNESGFLQGVTGSIFASRYFEMTASFAGNSIRGITSLSRRRFTNLPESIVGSDSGVFENYSGGLLIAEIPFTVTTGIPLQLIVAASALTEVALGLSGNSSVPYGGDSLGAVDYENTIRFARAGAVFELPPSFTANSIGGSIQNNQWLGATDVPEPSTQLLVAMGVVLIACGGLRMRQRTVRVCPLRQELGPKATR